MMAIGSAGHVLVLPFCPMVLLATNSASSIIMSAMLAVSFLGEQIIWKYDLVAFGLIATGCTMIVMLSKEAEQQMTTEKIKG